MIEVLAVAISLSWLAIIGLLVTVLALTRQIGLLHERIRPVGALSLGKVIKVGDEAPVFNLPSLTGGALSLAGFDAGGLSTLLFFLSPTCPVCKTLLPVLKSAQAKERAWLRVILASDGDEAEQLSFIRREGLNEFPYLLSPEVGMSYQIAKLPYGVLIDASGKVTAHGLINTREHLDSLFEAKSLGYATVQQFHAAHG
jgi:methylamine dehydrogenase accessory protein MauD